jgi:hypothetical protein
MKICEIFPNGEKTLLIVKLVMPLINGDNLGK